jgi:uncharacterized protein (TIGR03083 family)
VINAQTYLEHIRRDGARIAEVADGHLADTVPSCPGNTVESLLLHIGGVLLFWTGALENNGPSQPDFTRLEGDILDAYKRELDTFVNTLSGRDPDEETWVWGYDPHVRFWYRRAAQELSIHRWDFENAVGDALSIDPTLASDGVDELLSEFGPKPEKYPDVKSASELFDGNGERLRLEATDVDRAWTITARPTRFDVSPDGEADVNARGTASDINLFVWGRVPPSVFDVSGDASLLDRWRERVKI